MAVELLLDQEVAPGEAIVRLLRQAGVTAAFGMPGGYTFALFDALRDHADHIRTVLVREEARAGVMAEVYGRLTGRPGVAIGQGAFLVHASLGALEGHLSSSPMLLLGDLSDGAPFSQHGPYQSGTGDYGSWDARAVFGGMTKATFVAHSPVEAVVAVQQGLKHALTGEPGPVAVLFHSQALRGRVGPQTRPALYGLDPYLRPAAQGSVPAAEAVADAAQRLLAAERPVIVAGGGVRLARAYGVVAALAEALGAPVASTASGKGCYPETGPWAVGVMGNFGTPLANAVVGEADAVVVVGSKLAPTDTANEHPDLLDPRRQAIIQIDVDARNAAWTFPAELSLVGDAAVVGTALLDALEAAGGVDPARIEESRTRLEQLRDRHGHFDAPELEADKVPILPQRVIGALSRRLPAEGIVTCDAGENRIFMTHYFRSGAPGSFLQPAGVGGMGYAVPAALAAKVVHPDRPVVALCGDGGFAIGMNGLMTALEENLPVAVIVLNNQALGWVLHGQKDRAIASSFGAFDHAAIARAMGCRGLRVERPEELDGAIDEALCAEVPTVVDVRTSLEETFERVTSPLMRRRA